MLTNLSKLTLAGVKEALRNTGYNTAVVTSSAFSQKATKNMRDAGTNCFVYRVHLTDSNEVEFVYVSVNNAGLVIADF